MLSLMIAVLLTADGGVDAGSADGGKPDGGAADAGVVLGPCREKQVVCFSPGGSCHLPLIAAMDRATKQLDVAIYSLNYDLIVDAVIRANARPGVKVRVLVDATQYKSTTELPQLRRIAAAGISLKRDAHAGIMHLKVAVVDSREFAFGSFNFTHPAVEENDETLMTWDCPKNAVLYQAKFDEMWRMGKDVVLPPLDGG